ncbi:hypothetical protein SHL15_0081 [Streptomyces hygroscopicus subsp. limoneus]|nr:hypothetical protein SHL15_0081 [Streptomyces hygroscopicus subsp. limoneus]
MVRTAQAATTSLAGSRPVSPRPVSGSGQPSSATQGFLLAVFAFAVGTQLATGPTTRRTTMGGVASVHNAGPALAAIGLAFADQPAILGALAAILLSGLAAALPIATLLGRHRSAPKTPGTEVPRNDMSIR